MAATTTGKVETVLGDLRKLPLLPTTSQQAMALASDDNSNLHEFTRLIERDVTLASSILKLANSPTFTWGHSVDSLGQAVVRLGLRECQNLMVAVSMGNLFQKSDPRTKGCCAVLWKHCFLTACLCRRLNQELHFQYNGEEFTAGLLHDLGRILIAVTMPERFPQVDSLDFVEGVHTLQREQAVIHTDHCELGHYYAQQNRLPASSAAAIRYHHEPAESRDHRGIVALVAVADHMANYLHREEKPEAYDVATNPSYSLLANTWSVEKAAEFQRIVPKVLRESERMAAEQSHAAAKPAARKAPAAPAEETNSTFWNHMSSWLDG